MKCVDNTFLYDNYIIEQMFYHTWDYLCLCPTKGIVINNQKFQFCKKTVIFPGLNITPSGITPSSNILSAIREFLSHKISQVPVLEIMGGQWSLTARIWYMNAQKAFTMIKVTAEFFLISKIKFSFNLGSVPLN